jgi:cytochrome P450
VLVTHGEAHLRRRKQALPPLHGEALRGWTAAMAEIAHAELDSWAPGRPLATLPRMQALTLEVIQRVVFGSRDAELRDALRAALDMTQSTPNLIAMSLVQRDLGPGSPFGRFLRAVERIDALLAERLASPAPGSVAALLKDSVTPDELRDQVVTLLAAGHETTATALAWALERLARHPAELAALRSGDDARVDAAVKEVLRVRPVLSIASRKVREPWQLAGHTLPAGVYVGACLYLAHRRADVWPDPTAFRPKRFLGGGAPEPFAWVPFGGGVRRCLGASFAALEMREVLRAVAARFSLRPDRPEGERMRRRSITLAPARGGTVIPDALA